MHGIVFFYIILRVVPAVLILLGLILFYRESAQKVV